MNDPLPLDDDRACAKCNADGAAFRYCEGDPVGGAMTHEQLAALARAGLPRKLCHGVTTNEHQHRTCLRCGFEWLEHVYVPPKPRARSRKRVEDDEGEE